MRKLFILLSALLVLTVCLFACDMHNGLPPETTEPMQTTPLEPEPPIEKGDKIKLLKRNEKTLYRIVYAKDAEAIALELAKTLNDTYKGIEIQAIADDSAEAKITWMREILVGETNRSESEAAKAEIKEARGFNIHVYENGKIAIAATDISSLSYAQARFMRECKNAMLFGTVSLKKEKNYLMEKPLWEIDAPEFSTLYRASVNYDCGTGMNGTESSTMYSYSDATREAFDAYIVALTDQDFEIVADQTIGGNRYVQTKKDSLLLYTYYIANTQTVRVIHDVSSIPQDKFEYSYEAKSGEDTLFIQYGMMYHPTASNWGQAATSPYPNYTQSGEFYIIRLADNSLILIDGGDSVQVTDQTVSGLLSYLYEITGTPQGEKLRIASLFFSHPHGDHKAFIEHLVRDHADKLSIERVMFNFPSGQEISDGAGTFQPLFDRILASFPNVKFIKPHTGQTINLGNITLEIAYTHEDMVDEISGKQMLTTGNGASTILKITISEKTFLLLNDWGGSWSESNTEKNAIQDCLLEMYDDGTKSYPFLKSYAVQAAHHGINYWLERIYLAIGAQVALFPQADCKYKNYSDNCFRQVIDHVKKAGATELYFSSRRTWCFKIEQDGTVDAISVPLAGVDEAYLQALADNPPYTP